MPASKSDRGGEAITGCREPQRAQKISCSATLFPHWLQKGIYGSIRAWEHESSVRLFSSDFAMRSYLALLCLFFAPARPAAKNMEVFFIDVEGGRATLCVSPSGESMLVDTGWTGFSNRDAMRIS